ncbi:MAG: CoA pyrophosphatase [Deltaproteobacteria bacterium]|nr:CoA pyrophosphatase [Deltaproteobacteria bacterium]
MEIESAFGPPDLEPSLSFLEAHFASAAPIRNYHTEAPVSEQVRQHATPSAVLVPIVQHPDQLTLLLTRRHHEISYPGQLCFPGGRADPGDSDAQATALREAREEIDLDPSRVRILGTLGDYHTQSGYRITPVVGLVTPPLDLTPSPREVVEILEVPFSILTQARNYRIWRTDPQRDEAFYALEVDEVQVTGPTVCLAMGFYEALAQTHLSLAAHR